MFWLLGWTRTAASNVVSLLLTLLYLPAARSRHALHLQWQAAVDEQSQPPFRPCISTPLLLLNLNFNMLLKEDVKLQWLKTPSITLPQHHLLKYFIINTERVTNLTIPSTNHSQWNYWGVLTVSVDVGYHYKFKSGTTFCLFHLYNLSSFINGHRLSTAVSLKCTE